MRERFLKFRNILAHWIRPRASNHYADTHVWNDGLENEASKIESLVESYRDKFEPICQERITERRKEYCVNIHRCTQSDISPIMQFLKKQTKSKAVNEKNVWNSLYSPEKQIGTTDDPIQKIVAREDYTSYGVSLNLYRGLDIMDRVIDSPVELAIKKPVRIEILTEGGAEDKSETKRINKRLEELDYKDVLRRLLIKGRISSRGSMILPVSLDQYDDVSEPIPDKISRIEKLNVLSDYSFSYAGVNNSWEVWKPDYGMPSLYTVGTRSTDKSRFFHYIRNYDEYMQIGVSELGKNINAVKGLNIAELSFVYLLLQTHLRVVKYPIESFRTTESEKITGQAMSLAKRIRDKVTNGSYTFMPNNFDIEFKGLDVGAGIQWITDYLIKYIAMTSKIPEVVLLGSGAGAIAEAEKNMRQYYEYIKAEIQSLAIVPAMKFLADIIGREDGKPNAGRVTVLLEPIKEMDKLEQLEIEKRKVEVEDARSQLSLLSGS